MPFPTTENGWRPLMPKNPTELRNAYQCYTMDELQWQMFFYYLMEVDEEQLPNLPIKEPSIVHRVREFMSTYTDYSKNEIEHFISGLLIKEQ